MDHLSAPRPVERPPRPTRRTFLTLTAIVPALAACGGPTDPGAPNRGGAPVTTGAGTPPPLPTLRIRHPQNLAFAAPFQLIESQGVLGQFATTVDVGQWSTPDMLRSMLLNGESEVTAVPTYVGANLANRGIDVAMAAVVVWGLLWLVGPEDADPTWDSLRGQRVMVPFPNDMPDLVFRYLAAANGLTPGQDFQIEYLAQPPEVVSRLATGKGTWAVLPEHTATLALNQTKQNGQPVGRVLDLQQEWASATGAGPRIPQAGIVVPTSLAQERPALLGAILDELERAVQVVNAAEPSTVTALAEGSGVPEPVVKDVIPRLNLQVVPAAQAREELEQFFTNLATLSEDIIGGGLPAAEFYLDDPR